MAIIFTHNTSGAIRRLRRKKPTKAYKEALKKHIKYLQKIGFNCDDNGRIQLTTNGGYYLDIAERTMSEPREKTLSDVPMSNKIGHGGTNLTFVGRLRRVRTLQLLQRTTKVLIW